jgi:hypothetical protein
VATTTRDNAERLGRLIRAWHEAAEGMRRLCGGAHTHGDHTASSSFASTIVCVVYDGDIVHVKDNKADGLAAMGYVWSENDAPAPRRSDAPLTGRPNDVERRSTRIRIDRPVSRYPTACAQGRGLLGGGPAVTRPDS